MAVSISLVITTIMGVPWLLSCWINPQRTLTDVLGVLIISCIRHRNLLYSALVSLTNGVHMNLLILLVSISTVVGLYYLLPDGQNFDTVEKSQKANSDISVKFKPMLFPCRTTHTRLFPKKHSFSYSYLFAGVPIGWSGSAGSLLSANAATLRRTGIMSPRRTWFSVEAEDYLQRGSHADGLKGKLHEYLRSIGVSPEQFPYAYLVTAPRFFGYSFNPVSFWYLYSQEFQWTAMILEVNNTFDERRMYFLEKSEADHAAPLKDNWTKDFHVSPFNSRDGSYSVTATNPFIPGADGICNIDVNLVLNSLDGKAKLVARVFSTDKPVIAETSAKLSGFNFVLRWWWVGLVTAPRILREARKLWWKNLEVFYRPEVLSSSMGRQETHEETIIEAQFSTFLQSSANMTNRRVEYTSCAGPQCGKPQYFGPPADKLAELKIAVLTPAFYTEIVRVGSVAAAIKQLGLVATDSERMVQVSTPQFCDELFKGNGKSASSTQIPLSWQILNGVRTFKASGYAALLEDWASTSGVGQYFSELDKFVADQNPNHFSFVKSSLTILISDSIALGNPTLLRLYGLTMRLVGYIWASRLLDNFFGDGKWISGDGRVGQGALGVATLLALTCTYTI